ncbi:SCO family protein [Chitinophaga horti]|uniref:SCO family protein n=1 Tax=Chitinophaga horti TaxID=2920382 RepID=A0ABY6IYU0_9BACT|nr:SCO family protein [Chitinophaga horti]UYQ92583.1 SCO family protein [Chitinophaga horti]
MSKKTIFITVFFVALSAVFLGYASMVIKNETGTYFGKEKLPVLGTPGHKIKSFSFTNQDGQTVTRENVEGRFYVAEFFFTTCTGICPKMNTNLEKVYKTYKSNPNFLILSHTVDPEVDTLPALRAYAQKHHADPKNWWFLTGSKRDLYKMARESYMLDDGTYTGPDDFVHTQWFALVDTQGRVRGFYEGTKTKDIDKLISDIDRLIHE